MSELDRQLESLHLRREALSGELEELADTIAELKAEGGAILEADEPDEAEREEVDSGLWEARRLRAALRRELALVTEEILRCEARKADG